MRSWRRVTDAPTGIPSRILKPAIDLRALFTVGCWPAITANSFRLASISFELLASSPKPLLIEILSNLGTS